ncbi:MAG: ABC transporter permease [[Clostridium] aminophilum]|uniref:ABC transporter permease n=1 Tax=[Clostridium] aminophilum TaxID=1526 RepID=UPI0026EB8917|nr:ABC transporter permease [[Clostridium] aminophilum]MDD6195376.1 ABC transporter permease [[Clostridium] aminophilum]
MNKTKKIAGMLGIPYTVWAAVFIIVPLLMVFWYGLTDASGHFTLANVASIAEPAHSKALLMALILSLIATGVCLLLAYPLSMFLVETQKTTHSFLAMLLIVPMWMNFLLRTMAWQTLLEKNGVINGILSFLHLPELSIINTPGAIILGMVYNFLPFMVLPIYHVLAKIDDSIINAAHDLGADHFQTLTRILLPLSIPGIVSGVTMVFVPALTTFVISDILGGGKIMLIGNAIDQSFTKGSNWNLGAGLSLVLMIFILASMAILNKYDKDGKGGTF